MPFIRYDIGDMATQGPTHCSCGRDGTMIRELRGRMVDIFPLADGREMHSYDLVSLMMATEQATIYQYQFVQESKDRVVLRIVPFNPKLGIDQFAVMQRKLVEHLGPTVHLDMQLVDEIAIEECGKYRVSRSNVSSVY